MCARYKNKKDDQRLVSKEHFNKNFTIDELCELFAMHREAYIL
jgi:hypothetical protein